MASRVYDELYAEYGRMPTEEEVLLRLQRRVARDCASASTEARPLNLSKTSVNGPQMRPLPRVPGIRHGAWRNHESADSRRPPRRAGHTGHTAGRKCRWCSVPFGR